MNDHPKLEAETVGLLREHVEGMLAQARSEFAAALKAAMVRKRVHQPFFDATLRGLRRFGPSCRTRGCLFRTRANGKMTNWRRRRHAWRYWR